MTNEDALREWLVQLSDMIGGDLREDSSLNTAVAWFGDLDAETQEKVWELGEDNPAIESFLAYGRELMREVLPA
jgi:hypothetical protein